MRSILLIATTAAVTIIAMAGDVVMSANVIAVTATDRARTEPVGTEIGPVIDPISYGQTVSVEGIRVHVSIADNVARLLADARADGIVLGGWGWRSHTRQHQLRRINGCPDGWIHTDGESVTDFAPARQCRVPTARPGASLHERGLAIDFTCNGRSMAGTSCFRWLVANAHRYGLKNLPSEPWHWSTTGR